MARYEISNEIKPLDKLITGFACSCGYDVQTVFNDLLRFIIHGFSPGAPPIRNRKYSLLHFSILPTYRYMPANIMA